MAKIRYVYIPFVFLGKQGNRTSEWSCNSEQCLKMSVFYDALLLKKKLQIFSPIPLQTILSYNHTIILFSEDHLIEFVSKLRLWHYPLLAIVLDYPLDYVSSSTSQRKPA